MLRRLLLLTLCAAVPTIARAQDRLRDADAALSAGQAWHATELLGPLLASPGTRTPEAVILAARAAAGWGGWSTVRRLLERETWLDTQFDGLGRRLLAEAALDDRRDRQALGYAVTAAAPSAGRDAAEQAKRLVILARAYDRLDQLDSAATNYRRAAALLPDLADWLSLRAAGVTSDSVERALLYGHVNLPAATPRIPWTEALARDRFDDFTGAAVRYERLGARTAAIRIRWRGAGSDSTKRALAGQLAGIIRSATSAQDARDALELASRIDPPFNREDRLAVARRAVAVSRAQDAVDFFSGAARTSPLAARDRLSYGTALGLVGRWADAAIQFDGVRDPAVAGHAAYYHARAMLRAGSEAPATTALLDVIKKFASDTFAASTALYLLGDLAIDAGVPDSARTIFRHLAAKYPTSTYRARAELIAALVAYEGGEPKVAVGELRDALERAPGEGTETDAFRYWLARAHLAAGDSAAGRAGLRELIVRGPESYYALRAAAQLDTVPWQGWTVTRPLREKFPVDSIRPIFGRATRLMDLGLDVEARFELDRFGASARTGDDTFVAASAFAVAGYPARATQLALRALALGVPKDSLLMRLLYPLPFGARLRETATRERVDPLLAAAVIRQESGFDPRATSRADARGLMQVTPSTGKALAQTLGMPDFDPAVLWLPDVSLSLGMHHFALSVGRYPEPERALAAYNAGTSRVDRWSLTPLNGELRTFDHVREPINDIEIFVERIPFVETRDYVRAIFRNLEIYRLLYGKQ